MQTNTHQETPTSVFNPALLPNAVVESGSVIQKSPEQFDSVILEGGLVIDENSTTCPIWALVLGKNPRTYFDPVAMAELEDTIGRLGVLQPILVRINSQRQLEIVAGERRYRAASKLFGENYNMPISLKLLTDEETSAAAIIENHTRDPVSITEEAVAAAKVLADNKGDRDETAKFLGWTRKILDNRLALLTLSEKVQKALNERKITISMAEILATISRERQDTSLEKILANNYTLQQVKDAILQKSKLFSAAIFDKAECATCQYNSDLQSSLFSENIGAGTCSNSPCYDKKTESELIARQEALKDEYPVVKFINPGDNFTVIRISEDGKNAVGPEQALACKACANYGGAISKLPDSFGMAFKGQCFDTKCNKEKVAAYAKSLLPPPPTKPTANKSTTGNAAASSSSAASEVKAAPKVVATSVAERPAILEFREKVWREALRRDLSTDREKSLSLLFGLAATGNISHVNRESVKNGIYSLADKVAEKSSVAVSTIAKLSDTLAVEHRLDVLNGLTRSAIMSIDVPVLKDMMVYVGTDLSKHWSISAVFFDLLTKSEIEVVATEIGLKAHLDKAFAGLLGKKKDELIKALMESKFDFTGIVPKIMNYTK